MMGTKQDEAGLILKLYEMRRDTEFRKAREWFDTGDGEISRMRSNEPR